MADEITETLQKKVGPLPVGVWIVAVGAGIGIAWYMRRNAGGGADELPTETDYSDYELGGNTSTPSGVGGGAGGSGVPPLPTAPADNDEWFRRAADALVSAGDSGSVVQASLGKFLSGESLNDQDRAIVDRAIRAVGNPPTAPPPAPNRPPNPPVVTPKPPPTMPGNPGPIRKNWSGHTVLPGQNIKTIAAKYHTTVGRIFASNAVGFRRLNGTMGTLRDYNDVRPGVVLIIPDAIKGNMS